MPGDKKSDAWHVASVVSMYWFVSISMVYLNKMLLSDENASIPAPFFVTWYQCVLTCVICVMLGNIGESFRSKAAPSFFNQFPVVNMNLQRCLSILPLSLVFVGMIAFNNLCLKFVEVSFYNVARSLTLVFNVILGFVMMGQTTSYPVIATLAVVILGFIVGVDGEVNFSFYGTSAGVVSSLFVALNAIYTSKLLPLVDNDKSKLLFANNLNASILFIPLVLYFEIDILVEHWGKLESLVFWMLMSITGSFGFLIGLVTVMQVKATSALTHTISGTAKAAVQSLLAFYVWGNTPTTGGLLGIALVLGGSFMYAVVQSKGSEPARGKPLPSKQIQEDVEALLPKEPDRSS